MIEKCRIVTNLKYREDDQRLGEINILREKSGLQTIEHSKRNCLKCNKEFLSIGPNERMCKPCKLILKNKREDHG